ncbi:hypothetical protein JYK14_25940, partial [Siccirubricoccus sp. KC 17139]
MPVPGRRGAPGRAYSLLRLREPVPRPLLPLLLPPRVLPRLAVVPLVRFAAAVLRLAVAPVARLAAV